MFPALGSGPMAFPMAFSPKANSWQFTAGGGMVVDEEVLRLLLHVLLKPDFWDRTVLDGFPHRSR